jgi:hypothetical protein
VKRAAEIRRPHSVILKYLRRMGRPDRAGQVRYKRVVIIDALPKFTYSKLVAQSASAWLWLSDWPGCVRGRPVDLSLREPHANSIL